MVRIQKLCGSEICVCLSEYVSDCRGCCKDDNLKQLAKEVDVIFTATPQGFLAGVLDEEILSNTKVIDLSANFRIKDVATYEKW